MRAVAPLSNAAAARAWSNPAGHKTWNAVVSGGLDPLDGYGATRTPGLLRRAGEADPLWPTAVLTGGFNLC